MSKPILYSTGCPRCKIIEAKLGYKNIDYEIVSDMDIIDKLELQTIPSMLVDGEILDFSSAIKWVNEQ